MPSRVGRRVGRSPRVSVQLATLPRLTAEVGLRNESAMTSPTPLWAARGGSTRAVDDVQEERR